MSKYHHFRGKYNHKSSKPSSSKLNNHSPKQVIDIDEKEHLYNLFELLLDDKIGKLIKFFELKNQNITRWNNNEKLKGTKDKVVQKLLNETPDSFTYLDYCLNARVKLEFLQTGKIKSLTLAQLADHFNEDNLVNALEEIWKSHFNHSTEKFSLLKDTKVINEVPYPWEMEFDNGEDIIEPGEAAVNSPDTNPNKPESFLDSDLIEKINLTQENLESSQTESIKSSDTDGSTCYHSEREYYEDIDKQHEDDVTSDLTYYNDSNSQKELSSDISTSEESWCLGELMHTIND